MSINKQHIIAYHPDNQQVATQIREDLAKQGYLVEGRNLNGTLSTPLRQSVVSPSGAILLLITDNFLKSEQCMNGAMEALQHWADSGQLVPIVADGRYLSSDGTTWESVPTSFERVSNIINYMNYWQDKYLALRKDFKGQEDNPQLEAQIEVTRQVGGEVGEFLRYLRNLRWHPCADFKSNNYAAFRQFTDNGYDAIEPKKPTATPVNIDTNAQPQQKSLAEIIQASGDELMAENTDIGKAKKTGIEEAPNIDLNEIPGLDQLRQLDQASHVQIASPKKTDDDEEGVELASLLNEVLGDDDEGEDFKFVGEDPDKPDDFNLDSLYEDDENTTEDNEGDDYLNADEVHLELVSDEDEGLVLRADGNGHSTPEEVLEHAVLLFDEGKKSAGLDFLQQTVQLNASDNTMRYYYAYALARYGQDFSNAKSQLEVILANDMEHTDALFLLGELSESQGEFEEAKLNFETVAALQPDFPEVYYRLGMLTLQHFEGQENLALEFFKNSVEYNQRNADAQYILATLYNETASDKPNAIKHFNLALKYDPTHSYANYNLALLYFSSGDRLLAAEHYQKAVALNPDLKSPENDAAFVAPQNGIPQQDGSAIVQANEPDEVDEVIEEAAQATEQLVENEEDELAITIGVEQDAAIEEAVDNFAALEELTKAAKLVEPAEEIAEAVDSFAAVEALTAAEDTADLVDEIEEAVDNFAALEELTEAAELQEITEEISEAVEAGMETMEAQTMAVPGIAPNSAPTLEDLLEDEAEEPVEAPVTSRIAEAKIVPDPSNKNFTATLEEILDQEDDMEGDEFVLPLSNDKPVVETKTVLITGATSGIGRATAALFAKHGYRVIATGRRADRLEELKAIFKEKYQTDLLTSTFDVRNNDAVEAAIVNLPEEWRQVDILINNAGLSRGLSPIHEGELEHWETMIDTNIKGLLYLTRAIAPLMVKRRSGHIINVASSAGKEVYPGGNVYCATKFAVDALTKSMRLDLYQHNIRVSQVAPGHVEETEFASVRFDGDKDRAAKVYENFQPLRASDVAEVIFFMATRPPHVNVQDVLMFGTQQAGSNFIDRSGR
ncbi:MAG: SDR family NAD(P)-dependent oxidoreductase [Saprospiraceae bacterium]|nr:SDR family NAD(P)-dependent oxidoreductase [Saprospiraceae bacterium]